MSLISDHKAGHQGASQQNSDNWQALDSSSHTSRICVLWSNQCKSKVSFYSTAKSKFGDSDKSTCLKRVDWQPGRSCRTQQIVFCIKLQIWWLSSQNVSWCRCEPGSPRPRPAARLLGRQSWSDGFLHAHNGKVSVVLSFLFYCLCMVYVDMYLCSIGIWTSCLFRKSGYFSIHCLQTLVLLMVETTS